MVHDTFHTRENPLALDRINTHIPRRISQLYIPGPIWVPAHTRGLKVLNHLLPTCERYVSRKIRPDTHKLFRTISHHQRLSGKLPQVEETAPWASPLRWELWSMIFLQMPRNHISTSTLEHAVVKGNNGIKKIDFLVRCYETIRK